jgi:serine/threonine-protein kinase
VSEPIASSPREGSVGSGSPGGAKLTLVAPPEALAGAIWLVTAETTTAAFAAATAFTLLLVPFTPWKEMRLFGGAAILTLFVELIVIRKLSSDDSDVGQRRLRLACVIAFFTSASLLYFFSPFSDTSAFITLALLLFGTGVPLRWAVFATLAVAIPHAIMQLGSTFGVLTDRGFYPIHLGTYARLHNLAQSLVLYGVGALLAGVVQKHTRRTLGEFSDAFRRNAEREALLQDARLALERAVGVGQPGRFSSQRMGSFILGDVLGRGGVGEVYEATHVATREKAAVKLLTRRRSSDGDVLSAFERETMAIASLSSPHVVRVLEAGAEEGVPYIAMERLIGSDLSALLYRRLFLGSDEVADMAMQAAVGLDCARARGIIHGDITPRNLFRTSDGQWKLVDFGGALLHAPQSGLGSHVGTPGYMAPEQLSAGDPIDHRVDVFALAVVAYRALTGRPAFGGGDAATTLYRVIHSMPPRPSSIANVSTAVDDVLRVGMAKAPEDRWDDAPAFAHALSSALHGHFDEAIARRAEHLSRALPWAPATETPVIAQPDRRRGIGTG